MSEPSTPHCGFDAAAYALGALQDDEVDRLQAHLAVCAVCADELAAFEHVAAALPLSVTQLRPPKRLRRRVLAEAREDPRAAAHTAPPERRAWNPFPGLGGSLARPAVGLACTALLALGAGGFSLLSGSSPSSQVYAAHVYSRQGTAQLRVSGGHADLIVQHLPQPSSGHIYEVWLKRGMSSRPLPTNQLFGVRPDGNADVAVPGGTAHLSQVLVTEEPAGGSPAPTGSALIVATL